MGLPKLKLVPGTAEAPTADEDIKKLAREDHERAFDLLVRRYMPKLYHHALWIIKDSEIARDVAQEAFVKAYHEPRLLDDAFHTGPWLYRVCTNRCYNLLRDRSRRRGILQRVGREESSLRSSHQAIDDVLKKEQNSALARVLDQLSPEHRTILILRYYHDLSYQEIADLLRVKIGTVMSRISRAKVRLHDLWEEEQNR